MSVGLCCAPKQKPWRSAQGHHMQSVRTGGGKEGTTGFHGQRQGPGCTHTEGSHSTLSQPALRARLRLGLGSGSQNAGLVPRTQSSAGPRNGRGQRPWVGLSHRGGCPQPSRSSAHARTRLASFFPLPPRSLRSVCNDSYLLTAANGHIQITKHGSFPHAADPQLPVAGL